MKCLKKSRLRGAVLLAAFSCLGLLSVPAGRVHGASGRDLGMITEGLTIQKGVTIDGKDVSGETASDLFHKLSSETDALGETPVTITSDYGNVETTLGALGYSDQCQEAVRKASSVGNAGTLLKRYQDERDLAEKGVEIPLERTVNQALIQSVVSDDLQSALDSGNGYQLTKNEDGSVAVTISGEVVSVDAKAVKEEIEEVLNQDWDQQGFSVPLVTADGSENDKKAEISQIHDLLGTYTTQYSTAIERAQNVERATDLINGKVLFPGDIFSVYQTISPITVENGYGIGHNYVGTKIVDGVGGGVCQVATTLYNAALRAEIGIVQRNNHSMTVSYVPISFDAAIAGGILDLKLKNTLDAPIYIEGTYDGSGNLTFSIYGKETRDPGRSIEFKSETTSTIEPGPEEVTRDSSIPVGTIEETQEAVTGYTAVLYKYVYENGALVDTVQVNTSRYQASPRKISVNPDTDVASVEAGTTEAPPAETPATEAPAPEAPATEAPATEAPAPATEAPAPVTEAPAPVTEAPVTEAPSVTPPAAQ